MAAHSSLGASSAYRWMKCPASVRMSEAIPNQSSTFASEGTAAHRLAEWCLLEGQRPFDRIGAYIDTPDGAKYEVTEEMASNVSMYVDVVESTRLSYEDSEWGVEKKFNLDWLVRGMFGTCDAFVKSKDQKQVHIFDLKYGAGVPVYAQENPQLMYYALGVLGDRLAGTVYDSVTLTIVQPRIEMTGVSSWTVSTEELYSWAHEKLLTAALATKRPNAPFSIGEHCKFCRALGVCPEFATENEKVMELAVIPQTRELRDPREISPADKGRMLAFLKMLAPWAKALEASAQDDAMRGIEIEGFKLVRKRAGNRRWKNEGQAEKAFAKYGEQIYEPASLKSPAQLEKVVGKEAVAQFTERPEAGFQLAPLSDKREAVNILSSDAANSYGLEVL
jgi:hypothetical protein